MTKTPFGVDFTPNGKHIVTKTYISAQLWHFEADLDISSALFKRQILVLTGCEFNAETNEIGSLENTAWHKLKHPYEVEAREHYKICKYGEYNLWSRFNEEKASEIRPEIVHY